MIDDPEVVLAATGFDSVRAAVQAEFDQMGRSSIIEPHFFRDPGSCRLESPERFAVIGIRRSYTGLRDHEFMVSAGTHNQWPMDFLHGITLDIAEAAEMLDAWQAGKPKDEVLDRYPFMIGKRILDEQRRAAAPGEWSWQGYLHPLYVMGRREMLPMLFAASKQPRLRTLFPFTSMYNVCFKDPFDPSWPHHLPSIQIIEKHPARYAVLKGRPRGELGRGELAPMIELLVTEVEQVFGPVDAD